MSYPPQDLNAPTTPCDPSANVERTLEAEPSRWKRFLNILGPGLISGASNNDPSAIATYATAGAAFGFALLWVPLLLLPMMAVTVYLSARLAMVSGQGLAGILRTHYPRPILYLIVPAFVCANTFNAGADLTAVAEGLHLILPALPTRVAVVPLTLLLLAVQIFGSYRLLASVFKWLTLLLFAFVAAGLLGQPDAAEVFRSTLLPHVRLEHGSMLVAMIGTALSPYLYFWQTSQRVEEEVCMGRRRLYERRGATRRELRYASWDVNAGMFFAALIIYFILLATAATLYVHGQHRVHSAAEAAQALAPAAGRAASLLFALGFIGAGLLAIPVLTSGAAYALAETFALKHGLDYRPRQAPLFYLFMAASTLIGMGLHYTGLPPISFLVIAATLNGLLTPPLLVLICLASHRRDLGPATDTGNAAENGARAAGGKEGEGGERENRREERGGGGEKEGVKEGGDANRVKGGVLAIGWLTALLAGLTVLIWVGGKVMGKM